MDKYTLLQIIEVEAQGCGNWTLYDEKNYMPADSFFTRVPGEIGFPHVCRIFYN